MATWGASFGEGLWGALDREAQDFQRRRKARKEQERQKRLAEEERLRLKNLEEEERLRQEELANQRALNLFQMQNQDAMPAYMGLSTGVGEQFVPVAMSQALKIAGVPNMTVGDHINALEAVKNKQAADALAKKEQQADEDRQYVLDTRHHQLWKNENEEHEYEEQQALKSKLEAEAEAAKALKKEREAALFDAQIKNLKSQANYHNAQANYWNNGGRSSGSGGKSKEQIDPEEQAFIEKDKAYKKQIEDLDRDIERLSGDAKGFESDSFDKADASKAEANKLRDKRREIMKLKESNNAAYSKWRTNKAAGKKTVTGSNPISDFFEGIANIVNGAKEGARKVATNSAKTEQHVKNKAIEAEKEAARQLARKNREDYLRQQANPIEAIKASPVSDYDRGIQERGELYGNIGRAASDFYNKGKKAIVDYFNESKKSHEQIKAMEALKNPEKAQLDALYAQGKISRSEYMKRIQELNGITL